MAKVMISMPDELLSRVDAEALRRSTSRSGFLRDAAKCELERRPTPEEMDAAIARLRKSFAKMGAFDSTKAIREQRDKLDRRDRRRAGLA